MRRAEITNLGVFFDRRARRPAIGSGAGGGCRRAYRQVRDRVDTAFDDKGEIALKNSGRRVRVFALAGRQNATVGLTQTATALALPDKPSTAVLPFQNMS